LRELQSQHRATGTVPTKAPKDLARRTWHGAAAQHAESNPDWKKKTNSFKGNHGEEVKLSKEANVRAGPTKKGLDSAMIKAGIHSKSRAEYHNIDHETDKKLVGGYASFAKNRYAKYRKFPGQK
jgi:hypothetical protein